MTMAIPNFEGPPESLPAPSPERRNLHLRQSTGLRFLIAGGVSFVANQALLYALYESALHSFSIANTPLGSLNAGLLVASALALEASILLRFALNDLWTFRARRSRPFTQRLLQSNVTSLGSPAIALAAVNLLTPLLGISYLLANAIGVALGLAWNWTWSNGVVWRAVPEDAASEVAP